MAAPMPHPRGQHARKVTGSLRHAVIAHICAMAGPPIARPAIRSGTFGPVFAARLAGCLTTKKASAPSVTFRRPVRKGGTSVTVRAPTPLAAGHAALAPLLTVRAPACPALPSPWSRTGAQPQHGAGEPQACRGARASPVRVAAARRAIVVCAFLPLSSRPIRPWRDSGCPGFAKRRCGFSVVSVRSQ